MKKIILLPILFISLAAHAEFSEIQDPDGYSNLREKPNAQSRILTKIPNGTHVYTPEMDGKLHLEHGWQMTYDLRGKKKLDGWVHTSRLIPLSRYESIPVTATADGFTCQKTVWACALNRNVSTIRKKNICLHTINTDFPIIAEKKCSALTVQFHSATIVKLPFSATVKHKSPPEPNMTTCSTHILKRQAIIRN